MQTEFIANAHGAELPSSQQDAFTARREVPIQLSAFEGPLDLLLFLIRRNEIDLYDIPIAAITDQYLAILGEIEAASLDIAGDFFVMAATLMYLKSRLLLPTPELPDADEDEEDEPLDPRWELVQQLLEYRKVKAAAQGLAHCLSQHQDHLPRHVVMQTEAATERPLEPSDRMALWNTFNTVLKRLKVRLRSGDIHDEPVTTAERMEAIVNRLSNTSHFTFSELLNVNGLSLSFAVSTFLALLELARLGTLRISQTEGFADILCERC
jgi:segregation and condensation protein A